MPTKRIIPCLDVKDGRVVKGVQFVELRDAGDPVELAGFYVEQGADELVMLDISASTEGRATIASVVEKVAAKVNIPFIVGGGIHSIEAIRRVVGAGANKVSLGSAAIGQPSLIEEAAKTFGSEAIVVAIDAQYDETLGSWRVYTHGGKTATDWEVVAWAKEVARLGAGEILLTSMDRDGEKSGFDIALTKAVSEAVSIPVIASGGAGSKEDFYEVFAKTNCGAALAASIFHYKETSVAEVKAFLREKGVDVK
ncbi:MAG TPA: imidazole glycerol phosphate synthase subunit HisF [Bacilli bacterium]|nr:imidazole glycerol phosphate synthase subunit HisF [Bacilli bacterium]